MLILTRKLGESIVIGDDIKLVILDIKGQQVRIGVQAPKNVSVHRGEIYQMIQEQNLQAAASDMRVSEIWGRLQKERYP